jgi:hypothetical protein
MECFGQGMECFGLKESMECFVQGMEYFGLVTDEQNFT